MLQAAIIFPHQLFRHHPVIQKNTTIYLIEEYLFFNQYNFHKQKLVLHRASMKAYEQFLVAQNCNVVYIEAQNDLADIRKLIPYLKKQKIKTIHFAKVIDDWLEKRISSSCIKNDLNAVEYESPNFFTTKKDGDDFFENKKKYFQTDFYIYQRKKLNILIDNDKKPMGGKWSFDAENRLKYPKDKKSPTIKDFSNNKFVDEAKEYVQQYFSKNYGTTQNFIYAVTHKDAEEWLQLFLHERFENFGEYEDAMVFNEHYLHHSILTPMLNIGLLNPKQIIDETLTSAQKNNVPLNSLEGFVRQIIGWREFIKIVYERESVQQRTKNYWQFSRKIPASFWIATTGIVPVDNVIKKVLKTGYNHHIERLMIMGNFMLLCEFDPNEVYKWFMELYVDAYDWVMVPNVYGMTQFADGGLITTKPYISGSNYLFKMSDAAKGQWSKIWDALFWRFMHVHRSFFLTNPRLGMLVKTFDKMDKTKQQNLLTIANTYLQKLDSETN